MKTKNENEKKVNKRKDTSKEYVDALQNKCSKLNVVRVDLYYKKDENNQVDVSLEEANSDFNRMMNNRRSKPSVFKDQVGYICKKEYTEDRGIHFHGIFFYDGQKIMHDIHKASEIGKYWIEHITKNKGSFNNCNLNADKKYGENNGIGMLDHRDIDKRKNLDVAIGYMCKDEQSIEAITDSKKNRSIVRGTMPKSKSKVGRPRK
jgi:hypothetical protein